MQAEKLTSVDQTKFDQLQRLVDSSQGLFRRQGVVVAIWRSVASARTGATRKLGPYWSLRYREQGRQRSFYLGRSLALAATARRLLAKLQRPLRQVRQIERWQAAARAALRRHKIAWGRLLQSELGAWLSGYEIRGLNVASTSHGGRLMSFGRSRLRREPSQGVGFASGVAREAGLRRSSGNGSPGNESPGSGSPGQETCRSPSRSAPRSRRSVASAASRSQPCDPRRTDQGAGKSR
ncbi:MAG: hypothetical protein AAF961_17820, partial [Planctomycetota bacterium]